MSVMTFGSKQEHVEHCSVVKIGFETKNSASIVLKLFSVAHICEPIVNLPVDLKLYPQLQSLDFTTDLTKCNQIKPDVLIGSDLYWSLLTGEMIKSKDGPVALDSQLGWILSGPIVVREGMRPRTTLVTHVLRVDAVIENRRLERILHSFWDLESLGI